MVRLFNVYFPKRTLLLVAVEMVLVSLAFWMTAFIHFGSSVQWALFDQHSYWKLGLVAAISIVCLYFADVYSPLILTKPRAVSFRLVEGLGAACLIIGATYYVVPSAELFRGFVVTGICASALFLMCYRQAFAAFNSSHERCEPAVIMGDGNMAATLAKVIRERPELGLNLVGYLGKDSECDLQGGGAKHLGEIEDVQKIIDQGRIKRVIVAMGDQRRKLPINELLDLKTSGVMIQDGADFYEASTGKLPVENLRLSWLIFSPGFNVSRITLAYKRFVSVLLAGFGLVLFSPLIGLIAIAIKLDSPGPAIFNQPRIGKGGQPFTLFKFRTMYADADLGGYARPAQENDRRVTRVGRWLRRSRLDEIPQLWNILLGQMYFVGPRPFVPEQERDLASQIPLYTQRWVVKPGATGWAQVQRGYCASLEDNTDKLAYDLFYIKNVSIGFDLFILFKTMKILLLGKGGR